MERTKQMEQEPHSLFGHISVRSRLKSRYDFLPGVKPSYFPAKVVRCNEWQRRSRDKSRMGMVSLNEEPVKGYNSPWLSWQCLNTLDTLAVKSRGRNGTTSMETPHVCVWADCRKHGAYVTMFSLDTSLHLG